MSTTVYHTNNIIYYLASTAYYSAAIVRQNWLMWWLNTFVHSYK